MVILCPLELISIFAFPSISIKESELIDEKIFRLTNQPSNQGGFLPIELSLTLDGISGVKIYQKINVNQKFLPVGYQTNAETGTLDFIIKKVDHELKDNSWVTNLSTISIPPSQPSNTRLMDDGIFSYLQIDEAGQINSTDNVTERTDFNLDDTVH